MSDLNEAIAKDYADMKLSETIKATGLVLPGRESQIARLIGDDFELTTGNDGRPCLKTRTGRSVGEELAERLSSPDMRHFIDRRKFDPIGAQLKSIVTQQRTSNDGAQAPGLAGTYGRS